MKKLSFLLLLICVFCLFGCTAEKKAPDNLEIIKSTGKIKIGVKEDSKPFGFIKDGKPAGFDVDVAKYIAERIFLTQDFEDKIEFIPVKASERISALNTDKVNLVIATLSINERRKEIIDFSIPYYTAGQALMVPVGSRISTVQQLNNKKNVAVVLGTTGEKTVRMLAPNANVIGTKNYKEAFEHLKNGVVDAILADDTLLYGLQSDNRGYKVLPNRFTTEYYAIGIKKGKENENLKKQVDLIIQNMQDTGRLNKIKRKWLPKSSII